MPRRRIVRSRPRAPRPLAAAGRRCAAVPRPLAALLAAATVMFLAWVAVLPALQAPDEAAHFAYAQRLAETGRRPPVDGSGDGLSTQLRTARRDAGLNALVGNLSAKPYWTHLDERIWRRDAARLPAGARSDGTGPDTAARNPPLYYGYAAVPYLIGGGGSFFAQLYLMRLWNLPLFLVTIVFTWLIAGELLGPRVWPRTVAAGAVALEPQLAFVCAGLSPDPMLTAIWTAFIYVAIRAVRDRLTWARAGWIVALAAASAYTHPRGVPLVLVAVLALALAALRPLRARLADARPFGMRLGSGSILAGGGAATLLVLAGGFFVLTRDTAVLGATQGAHFVPRQFLSYLWQFYLPPLAFMRPPIGPHYGFHQAFIETFYGVFASLEVRWPDAVYDLLQVLSVLGIVVLYALLVRRRGEVRRDWRIVVLLGATALVLVGALHYAAYRSLLVDPTDPIIVGRYLFPIIALFGVAIGFVVRELPRRLGAVLGGGVLASGALLGLSGLALTVARFYA